ncbi:MAG: DUF4956 domain-containing protein [Bacteroidaceae bacterium]|nr:DUF4956 domain-containing protein [Bacteroidaceae bacterium]MBR7027894.1 DUF4956 domain-containing protein [Bacteroidaceae bacterium]
MILLDAINLLLQAAKPATDVAMDVLETAAGRREHLVTFFQFVPLLLVNTFSVWFIVQFLYYPRGRNKLYYFTYILLSTAIFVLLFMAQGTKLQMGAALGLFAVFGILRYRTEQVSIREMTYMFYLVALSVANGTSSKGDWELVAIINIIFIVMAALMEVLLNRSRVATKLVKYDNIELIVPERRGELIADLEKRLGLEIVAVECGAVDFLLDCCLINVHYKSKGVDLVSNTVNQNIRMK